MVSYQDFSETSITFGRNRRACMTKYVNLDETIGVCKDRGRWRSVVSTNLYGKRDLSAYVVDFPYKLPPPPPVSFTPLGGGTREKN